MIQADLSLRAQQGLLLVPKMLQSIEVLQLASAELLSLIDQELEQNETLEAHVAEPELPAERAAARDQLEDEAWDPRRTAAGDGEDGKQALLDNLSGRAELLVQHIREQLLWLDLPLALRDAVLALAEHLDHRGFLASSDVELRAALGASFEEALVVLRGLDPPGIGARDAVDALLLQVAEQDPDREDIRTMLTVHLVALAANKLPEVARQMDRSVAEVQALLDRVRCLDPYPASRFTGDAARPLHPDLVVRQREGELEILVNDADLPSLGINEDYAAMARSPDVGREVKRYLRPKLESARSLIHAVEQRRRTLARVGGAVLAHQRAFLEEGRKALVPLKMAEIATMLDLHTSTVSRAVAGKYVQTDRGIYRLRDFFDGGRSRGARGSAGGPGRLGVQESIKELIADEEPDRPLSDDDVVALLAARGIRVARRTVTKYRKELGIPSSWRRRRSWDDDR